MDHLVITGKARDVKNWMRWGNHNDPSLKEGTQRKRSEKHDAQSGVGGKFLIYMVSRMATATPRGIIEMLAASKWRICMIQRQRWCDR